MRLSFHLQHSFIATLAVFFVCCSPMILLAANDEAVGIGDKLTKIESVNAKLDSLYSWSDFTSVENLDEALAYSKVGIAISENSQRNDWFAKFNVRQADIYQSLGKIDSSTIHLNLALDYYTSINDRSQMAAIFLQQSSLMVSRGTLDEAYTLGTKALRIYDDLKHRLGLADAYIALSDIHYYQEKYALAKESAQHALKQYETVNNQKGIIDAYLAISAACIGTGEKEESLLYIDKVVAHYKAANDELGLASVINSRGNTYKHLERYADALKDYLFSNKVARKFNHPGGIAATNANISEIYGKLGQYEKALPYILECISLQEDMGLVNSLVEAYERAGIIYESLNNPSQSLAYYKKYFSTRDSMVSLEKDAIISDLKTKYETDKKEEQIVLQDVRISQQNKNQNLTFAIMALLSAMIFGLIIAFRKNKSKNLKLSELNSELGKKNRQNELLLQEIHHRVKNNLQTISSLLNLQAESMDDPNAIDAVQESKNRVASMALIHQKLYQGENLAAIEMNDYFQTIGNSLIDSFGEQASGIILSIDMPKIELDVDTAIPLGLITNELITNSLKYAFENGAAGEISISLTSGKNNQLYLRISDNGVHQVTESKGKQIGFGSLLIQLLTSQLRGTLNTQKENGTSTTIQFPIQTKSDITA